MQKFQIKTCYTSRETVYTEFSKSSVVHLVARAREAFRNSNRSDIVDEKSLWPHFAMDVLLAGFDIRGNRDKVLNLQEFKLDSKVR